jgi:hypothetical protein
MRHVRPSVLALLLAWSSPALAAWPASGIVVADLRYSHIRSKVVLVPDGGHGVIVHAGLWQTTSRVDPEGAVLWSVNPFATASLPASTSYANATDGAGGLWFATQDANRSLVAVHYDATGSLQGDVVPVSENLPGEQYTDAAVPDGAGGMFVVWSSPSYTGEIRATRVDAGGNVIGPPGGVVVFGGPGALIFGGAESDGMGGLLVMTPEGGTTVQRLDATLTPRYGAGAVVAAPGVTGAFALAATGDGGAFVAWPEGAGASARVRVQRLDASGSVAPGWPAEGAIAARPTHDPSEVHVIADGTGGASVAWLEPSYDVPTGDVRVSRVLANGRPAQGWAPEGVLAGGGQEPSLASPSVLVADGTGGCYVAWPDQALYRGRAYVQHLSADGQIFPGWPAHGLTLESELHNNEKVFALADGAGGLYVAWDQVTYPMELRNVRLIRLGPGGESREQTRPQPSLSLARVAPNPASGYFTASATLPDDRPARLEVFDLAGRLTHSREIQGPGEHGLTLDGTRLATGVHWMRLVHPTGVRMARIVVVH